MVKNARKQLDVGGEIRGSLLVIGGHENKEGQRTILEEIAKRAKGGKLVVATIASEEPQPQWEEYQRVFTELGVRNVRQLDARGREQILTDDFAELLAGARVIFFAGGDQMKITSRFGGTALCETVHQMYRDGAMIAGTSSGASVLSEVMMAAGDGDASHEVGGTLRISPGLGLISGVLIDQHFAQRGRMGRLLGAVAQNPRLLGIGIDEDTALLIERNRDSSVIGSGAVYIVDGREISFTNTALEEAQTMSAFGIKLHVLSSGDRFDLETRQPEAAPQPAAQEV